MNRWSSFVKLLSTPPRSSLVSEKKSIGMIFNYNMIIIFTTTTYYFFFTNRDVLLKRPADIREFAAGELCSQKHTCTWWSFILYVWNVTYQKLFLSAADWKTNTIITIVGKRMCTRGVGNGEKQSEKLNNWLYLRANVTKPQFDIYE